jgi:protein gp37
MAVKTKIDWSDSTWNPVTGCLHKCGSFECYAKNEVRRFSGENKDHWHKIEGDELLSHICVATVNYRKQYCNSKLHSIAERIYTKTKSGKLMANPYPYGFAPTFHRYRLDVPQTWKTPRTIFVCSMADLFGEWVPNKWISDVFKACAAAPQHRYLFLTKNPNRYIEIYNKGWLPQGDNYFYGSTITDDEAETFWSDEHNTFLSIEPLLTEFDNTNPGEISHSWVIIGAETGSRKDKVIPKREWIETIVNDCKVWGVPVFLKESLTEIWGEPLIQEFPWEVRS